DDPDLDIDENSIIVLKNAGPVGYPGMPEVGNVDLPEKLLRKGIKDIVRISDGRMSGTAAGTVVLHVSPESAIGGTLALVQDGDELFRSDDYDWDKFVNDPNLFQKMKQKIKNSLPSKNINLENVLAPIGAHQELWACGVTYLRSKIGRQEESKDAGAGDFYA